ncbi:MAG TPA: hypothetical protein VH186_00135 [Chloroflexia bacterium]|nr:hypothetical protein [Chloroflexia bacterium]
MMTDAQFNKHTLDSPVLDRSLTSNSNASHGTGWFSSVKSKKVEPERSEWFVLYTDRPTGTLNVSLKGRLTRKQIFSLQSLLESQAKGMLCTRLNVAEIKNQNIVTLASLAAVCSELEHKGYHTILSGVPLALYQKAIKAQLHYIATFE